MTTQNPFQEPQKLTAEARQSVSDAFEALAQWREDMAAANERYSGRVFDQMAKATKTMGWPENLVEQTRDHLKTSTQMQLEMMDKVMEAWQSQIKNADSAMASPRDFQEQMKAFTPPGGGMPGMPPGMSGFPGMPGMPGMPDMSNLGNMPMAPFQFWMQATEMWQKNMATAMSMWMSGAQNMAKQMDPNKRK
ncbi:MAG: hypothetical protein AAFV45_02930 [Pseudomonadota bacterium]